MKPKKIHTYLPAGGLRFYDRMPRYGIAHVSLTGKGHDCDYITIQVVSAPSKTWGYVAHAYVVSPLFACIHKSASGYGYDKMGNAVARALHEAINRNGHNWAYGNVLLDDKGPQPITIPKKLIALMEELAKQSDCGSIDHCLRELQKRRGVHVEFQGTW